MGLGRFKDGKFDVVVSFVGTLNADEWFGWERAFKKASELLFNATNGQAQFGRIYVCEQSAGRATADFVVNLGSGTSTGRGPFGELGTAINTYRLRRNGNSTATDGVLMLVHELGHHAWLLGDERTGRWLTLNIDKDATPPNFSTVPILAGQQDWDGTPLALDSLLNPAPRRRRAVLQFPGGTGIERKTITTHDDRSVTVDSPFSQSPTTGSDEELKLKVDDVGECGNQTTDDYCIMEAFGSDAGTYSALDSTGVWQPAANPVTQFCFLNHDPDGNTGQEGKHRESCWHTMSSIEGLELKLPNDPDLDPPGNPTEPDWIVLDQRPRFALVLDRSLSMDTGSKMDDARHGAIYWLERAALDDDQLTIVWYDHQVDAMLDLTRVGNIPDLQPLIDGINALEPRGATNIRDGLTAARSQIESPGTRAAVQAALLLTDGVHNIPFASSALEVMDDFQDAGIRIFSLGVGPEGAVDMPTLETLAEETGGRAFQVGDNNPGEIEARMVEISTEARDGIVNTVSAVMPEPGNDASEFDRLVKQADRKKQHPDLKDVMQSLDIRKPEDLLARDKRAQGRVVAIPADIEEGSRLASFSVVHPKSEDVWLYLLDPRGRIVDTTDNDVVHVISPAPHEFALVQKPDAGRWWMLAVRGRSGDGEFPFHAVAGSQNLHVSAFGGATPHVSAKQPVRVWAKVRWDEPLSNVSVTAEIQSPDGKSSSVSLRDDQVDEPNSGVYEGVFLPEKTGRYTGRITIRARTGRARVADGMQRLMHEDKAETIELEKKVPAFMRIVPFTFEVGRRKKPTDHEQRQRITDRFRTRRQPISARVT